MKEHAEHGEPRADAPRVVGPREGAAAGSAFVIGGAIGALVGAALGTGRVAVPGLAPWSSGGAGVPAVILAAAFGSVAALAAALWTSPPVRGRRKARHHTDNTPAVLQLPIYGSIALVVFMLFTLGVIAARGWGSGETSDPSARLTWNLKNTTRVGGQDPTDTARRLLEIVYPSVESRNTAALTVRTPDDWRVALAATPLIAPPGAGRILIGPSDSSARDTGRTLPLPRDLGQAATAVLAELRRTGVAPRHILIVADNGDHRWGVVAGPYAARTGTPILFVSRDDVPPSTVSALAQLGSGLQIYVLAPNTHVSDRVLEQLQQYGSVTRIAGDDPIEHAIRFAEFYDPATAFGWGRTGRGQRKWASGSFILVNGDRWQDAISAAHLARGTKSGPLLYTDGDRVPAALDSFFWRQRPVFAGTPAEGPFNHVWIVGTSAQIGYRTQAWIDYSQEIEQYMTLGDSAVSGFEALGIVWLILSFASAVWILLATRRIAGVMPMMTAAWALFALLLGPLAVWLFVQSYHRRKPMQHDAMTMWERGPWAATVSATVMMFGFDMTLMVLAVFGLAYLGFPIIRAAGWYFWLGTPRCS